MQSSSIKRDFSLFRSFQFSVHHKKLEKSAPCSSVAADADRGRTHQGGGECLENERVGQVLAQRRLAAVEAVATAMQRRARGVQGDRAGVFQEADVQRRGDLVAFLDQHRRLPERLGDGVVDSLLDRARVVDA